MRRLVRRPLVLLIVVAVGIITAGWLRRSSHRADPIARVVQPTERDVFASSITTTGELRARRFATIQGPNSQVAEIFQTKITWMVPEGTQVKQGDRVAELDPAPAATRLQSIKLDLQKAEADFTNAQLDSAMTLSQAREDVRTAEYALEERTLGKQQAAYEAPTIKRQADLDYDRAVRGAASARRTLDIKTQQAVAKIAIASANVGRRRSAVAAVEAAIAAFTVYAPSEGLVIYLREGGRAKGIGSTYYPWDPTVATLPDLAAMQSQTYVNEVDIRSVAIGRNVRLTLDAEPGKHLTGRVISVANVGEQRPNQDAKVFEVIIDIAESDTTLRPGMTTANTIETGTSSRVLTIPIAAVMKERDQSFIYVQAGSDVVKQAVELGASDNLNVVVTRGLSASDRVLLHLTPTEIVTRTQELPGGTRTASTKP
jgi:HlyD family secretion protein